MPIRLATPQDAPALAALAGAFRNHLQRSAPSDAQFLASITTLLQGGDAAFYLASEDGQPVGYVLQRFRHSMWAAGLEATIEDLYVEVSQRQRGTGRQLIRFALEQARQQGCTTVCLDTNENNAASTKIYQDLGFSADSKRWNGRQLFYRVQL